MAEENEIIQPETLERARQLVQSLEGGQSDQALQLLDELSGMRESALFQELGKLTRELHDAMKGFQLDSRIASLAEKDIPDAKERLNYVITMTEQAAHRTLNAVEESLPLAEQLQRRAGDLAADWERFTRREMEVEDFRRMSRDLGTFLTEVGEQGARIHGNLSDVLMAQDFQDLTGQVIRRVIKLVQDVEDGLVGIIKVSGRMAPPPAEQQNDQEQRVAAEGPQVPGLANGEVVTGQDDVDDLLASLGF